MLLRGAVVLVALLVSACGVADRFGDRAIHYNIEAAKARNTALLLNVMRAAWRQPLLFSDVISVTGTSQITGGASANLPLLGQTPAFGGLFTLIPSLTAQSGPSFAVNVQNTREFYQGIMAPITPQTLDLLQSEAIPPGLLYTLFVDEIVVHDSSGHRTVFSNRVFDRLGYAGFRGLIDALVAAGMQVDDEPAPPMGAPVTVKDAGAPASIAGLKAQGLLLLPPQAGKGTSYHVAAATGGYGLCFERAVDWQPDPADLQEVLIDDPARVAAALRRASAATLCDRAAPASSASKAPPGRLRTAGDGPDITLTPRSIEGVIYYLGEIAREELLGDRDPITGVSSPPFTPALDYFYVKQGHLVQARSALFSIAQTDCAAPGRLTAQFQDRCYGIVADPFATDRSSQVLSIVLETLALNNSAKDQPAPSVISVIGQ